MIIKSFMQGYFHSLKSLFDVLQVVGVICNYLNVAVHNLRKFGIFHRHLLKGNIHTQFVTQNVKITFSVQPHLRTPEKVGCDQIFFLL